MNTSRSKELPDNQILAAIVSVLYTIRGSFFAFVFAVGVIWLLAGIMLDKGAFAGLLGIWGGSAILYAIVGKFVIKFLG